MKQHSSSLQHPCPHFGACPGCVIPFDYTKENMQHVAAWFDNHLCSYEYIQGARTHWRTRSKLAVRSGGIGLFQESTHSLISIPHCLVHHSSINTACSYIWSALKTKRLAPYNELLHEGVLRYIQCTVERFSGKVSCVFVVNCLRNSPQHKECVELCTSLYTSTSLFHSFALNFNTLKANTIFTNEWSHIYGPKYTEETLCGISFFFSYDHFMQANLEMYDLVLSTLQEWIEPNASIIELYGGIGVMGIVASHYAKNVIISDRTESSKESFKKVVRGISLEHQAKLSYDVGDAEDIFSRYPGRDTLIVDPPRKGLSELLLQKIGLSSLRTIFYLSCNFSSLERDVEVLSHYGFKVFRGKVFDFFPGTEHLEVLVEIKQSG